MFYSIQFLKTKSIVSDDRVHIVASFYPIAEFARQVGGDLISVETITPIGVEPHDYEPNAQQIKSVYESDIFLFNGAGIDTWAERISSDVSSHGVSVSEISKSINLDKSSDNNRIFDPHFWLNPVLAQQEVTIIENILISEDPSHSEIYRKNTNDYIKKLQDLDNEYRTGLVDCEKNTIVTSHDVLTYLASEYGSKDGQVVMNVISLSGLSPESEPSVGKLAEITNLIRKNNVDYIFLETLTSPKLSQTIANEVGVKILVFNPLEGLTSEESIRKENYITIMEENLRNLKIGMLCR